ncbi:MAG: hypothetical protein IM561_09135 [Microcystis sp. M60BS1]|uniref:hypothetical protein n=1 Tax=unclassified Microcystis TaxID=2643300 RepID=UPI00257B4DED|nr:MULTISPECIES: hypothetical protein [unclassified Microcystis]MCA2594396.1 hypothetical protein [Microcystis sp. M38BS1]MCA6581480.1 hypothetical protein [Pseudanabaena sp. M34BS1SP1A06MG]MCA2510533.1 hypothetical protein [Microcystis sp. M60BS1]MCA2555767.1 hypothetical protein [Microcystis sp. M43BS1]MCA2603404.1 hypothetical protein [Microcystis sp. M26BS1]
MPPWQGLWNQEANSQIGYLPLVNRNPRRNSIKRSMNRESFRVLTALFNALIGAAAGVASGNIQHRRIGVTTNLNAGSIQELGMLGGLRQIDVVTDINRNTTAADVTTLKEMVANVKVAPTTYPRPFGANASPAQNIINPR